jgi:hypothetical protein
MNYYEHLGRKDNTSLNKHIKRYLTPCIIRELQIKTLVYNYTPTLMAKIQNTDEVK